MSGPLATKDVDPDHHDEPTPPCVEVIEGRVAEVGGVPVTRVLPRRQRRTIGAWCFADHFGPTPVDVATMDVGPHPHIGLHTVTWLVEGEVLHRDSLGSEQLIRPGQLNLMTAGNGVSHSEETPDDISGDLHGIQFWVAQPESTRFGDPAFEHHAHLPQVDLGDGAKGTLLVGTLADQSSPARMDSPIIGVDLLIESTVVAPLDPEFEHGIIILEGSLNLDGTELLPGSVAYLGVGRDELFANTDEHTRAMLIGGPPLEADLVMGWNFVGRTRDEVRQAGIDWNAGHERFGTVASPLSRIPAPEPGF